MIFAIRILGRGDGGQVDGGLGKLVLVTAAAALATAYPSSLMMAGLLILRVLLVPEAEPEAHHDCGTGVHGSAADASPRTRVQRVIAVMICGESERMEMIRNDALSFRARFDAHRQNAKIRAAREKQTPHTHTRVD